MKKNHNSFGRKLWRCFFLYAAIIFAALWLLQTVFLKNFYDSMVIHKVKEAAEQIAGEQENPAECIDTLAAEDSLLIFLTDWDGTVLYRADEHSSVYEKNQNWHGIKEESAPAREAGDVLSWQLGALRNLPKDYDSFLEKLSGSEAGRVGYETEDGTAYIYGRKLTLSNRETAGLPDSGEAVLYISAQLGAVGATVDILRMQLVWVSVLSLAIGAVIACFMSRQFARPVAAVSEQARQMAKGKFAGGYEKGFCLELDELSDTLSETADALERLEHARKELLANVSHDLRTPLTMIKGYAELVRDISWKEDGQREEDLAVIIREADRLTALVNDILEYSALSQADYPAEFPTVDLSAVAREVAAQFSPLCERKGCRMKLEISPDLKVRGETDQLKRVFYNLLDNGIRYAGETGQVCLSVRDHDGRVRVEIRDNGPGIPQEDLSHIWERYFTFRQRRSHGGSGLGLAIVKAILERQNAGYGVESSPGRGSLFWFELERSVQQDESI